MYIYNHTLLNSCWSKKYFRQIVEKIKTHILCSRFFFFNRAVYGIMWKDTAQPDNVEGYCTAG